MDRYIFFFNKQLEWTQNFDEFNKSGLKAGYCQINDGSRKQADLCDYLDISQMVECAGLPERHATELINVIKRITRRNEDEIPLPSEYRTMKSTILAKTRYKSLPITKMKLKYPFDMFGDLRDEMRPMTFVFLDIKWVLAELLINTQIVGNNLFYVYWYKYTYIGKN